MQYTNNKKLIEKIQKFGINDLEKLNILEIFTKELIIDELIRNISFSDEQISYFIDDFKIKKNLRNINSFEKFLFQNIISKELFIEKLIRSKKSEKFCRDNFKSKAKEFFFKNRNLFDKVTYSLIRLIDYQLAKELYLQIEGGEKSINDLSVEYSLGEEKNSKGLIGPVPINQGHPLLKEKLLSCNEGDLTEPFKIDKIWIILKIERIIKVEYDNQLEFKICNEFFEKLITEKTNIIIKEIRSI